MTQKQVRNFNHKIIEAQEISELIGEIKFYRSKEEILENLDILRKLGLTNNQNRNDNGFPILKSEKSLLSKIVSSSSNIASIGRLAQANLILVGERVYDIVVKYQFEKVLDAEIILIKDFLPLEVLSCKYFTEEITYRCKNIELYQFSGFIASFEHEIKAQERELKINKIING